MTEIIFGLGSHSTLFDVVSTALTEIEQVFGEIVANAPGITVHVQRPGYSAGLSRHAWTTKCCRMLTESDGALEFRAEATDDPERLPQ